MDRRTVISVVLALLLLCTISASYLIYTQQQRVIEEQRMLIEHLISTGSANSLGARSEPAGRNRVSGASSANIVAVRSDTYAGVIGKVHVELKEGDGDVLVNTNPFVEPATQYSVREAVKVAENFTGTNLSNRDVTISFEINGTLIGGPSAGAATAVATIAVIEGKGVRQDAAITGTIEAGGYIGPVGGVFEKAVAAEKNGIKLLLVPKGQKKVIYYEQKIEERELFGFTFTRVYYVPREIDLGSYMEGKMDVREVATIGEAVAYLLV